MGPDQAVDDDLGEDDRQKLPRPLAPGRMRARRSETELSMIERGGSTTCDIEAGAFVVIMHGDAR